MSFIVAPEPGAAWLAQFRGVPFAPWALGPLPRWLPGFFTRRQLAGARALPGWPLAEAALRLWTRAQTERTLFGRFMLRAAVDWLAARYILRERPSEVVAPSCAARRSFAAARAIGARTVLVEDLADLRGLHEDLDHAARAHPECRFLRNYRAPAKILARQETERLLADELFVRGRHAWSARVRMGFPAAQLRRIEPRAFQPLTRSRGRNQLLLAGLAAARHGTVEALAALAARPDATLFVHGGPGTEPDGLLQHPRVRRHTNEPVSCVLAIAWCESYPSDVPAAAAAGIPIIATQRAAGFTETIEVPPGDALAVARALAQL